MKIIDTHSHILRKSYVGEFELVFNKLKEDKNILINVSYDLTSSQEVMDLYKENRLLFPSIGIHPDVASDVTNEMLIQLEEMITEDVVSIGEIGLDYHYPNFDAQKQKQLFICQIEIAIKHNLPVIIHTRDSIEDCYEIIKNYPNQKFLLHSWSGTKQQTNKFLKISDNIYFSFNGIITFKNAKLQKETLKLIPIKKLLFETDCPYLSPTPFRGKKNYPWRVKEVIEFSSNELEINFNKLNKINSENAISFFDLESKVFDET